MRPSSSVRRVRPAPDSKSARFRARCLELGKRAPARIPRRVWGLLRLVDQAASAQSIRHILATSIGVDRARVVELHALGPDPETGECPRTLLASRPRAIVRCAIAAVKLRRRVGKRALVEGVGRGLWCVLAGVSPQTGRVYSVSAVCNRTHRRDGAPWRGDAGFLPTLELAGLFRRMQPPATADVLVGPSGFAYAQHWSPLSGVWAPRALAPPPS